MTVAMDNELTCCVCLDLFSAPVMLPCSHNYCKKCIEDLVRHGNPTQGRQGDGAAADYFRRARGKQLTCPKCRRDVQLDHRRGVEGLPANRVLENIVKVFQTSIKDDQNDFSHSDSDSLDQDTNVVRKCLEHNKTLSYFCQTCNRGICKECAIKSHTGFGHFVRTTSEWITDEQEKVFNSLQELQMTETDIKKKLENVDHQVAALKSRECQMHQQIDEEFKSITRILDTVRARLQNEVTVWSREQRQPLEHLATKYALQLGYSRTFQDQYAKIYQQKEAQKRLMLLKQIGLNLSSFLAFKHPMAPEYLTGSPTPASLQHWCITDIEKVTAAIREIHWKVAPGLSAESENKEDESTLDGLLMQATGSSGSSLGATSVLTSEKNSVQEDLGRKVPGATDKVLHQGARPKVRTSQPNFLPTSNGLEGPTVHRASPCAGLREQLDIALQELQTLSRKTPADHEKTPSIHKRCKHGRTVGEIATQLEELQRDHLEDQADEASTQGVSSLRSSSPASDGTPTVGTVQPTAVVSKRFGGHLSKTSKVFIAPAKLNVDSTGPLWSLPPASTATIARGGKNFLTSPTQVANTDSTQIVTMESTAPHSPFKSAFPPDGTSNRSVPSASTKSKRASIASKTTASLGAVGGLPINISRENSASPFSGVAHQSEFVFGATNSPGSSSFTFSQQMPEPSLIPQRDRPRVFQTIACYTEKASQTSSSEGKVDNVKNKSCAGNTVDTNQEMLQNPSLSSDTTLVRPAPRFADHLDSSSFNIDHWIGTGARPKTCRPHREGREHEAATTKVGIATDNADLDPGALSSRLQSSASKKDVIDDIVVSKSKKNGSSSSSNTQQLGFVFGSINSMGCGSFVFNQKMPEPLEIPGSDNLKIWKKYFSASSKRSSPSLAERTDTGARHDSQLCNPNILATTTKELGVNTDHSVVETDPGTLVNFSISPIVGTDSRAEACANGGTHVPCLVEKDEKGVGTSIKTGLNSAVCTIKNLCRGNFSGPGRTSLDVNANDAAVAAGKAKTKDKEPEILGLPLPSTENKGSEPNLAGVLPDRDSSFRGEAAGVSERKGNISFYFVKDHSKSDSSGVDVEPSGRGDCVSPSSLEHVEGSQLPGLDWRQIEGNSQNFNFTPTASPNKPKSNRHYLRKGKRRN